MKNFEKIVIGLIAVMLAVSLVTSVMLMVSINSLKTVKSGDPVVSETTSSAESTTTGEDTTSTPANTDEVNLDDYVTYFDLAYAAYTNPDKFLGKEITLVGYYSSSTFATDEDSETTESTEDTKESADEPVYHFLTAYGQVDECHITAEFTTADGKYPDAVGTVIKITGTFESYEENGNTYYTISADTYSTIDA